MTTNPFRARRSVAAVLTTVVAASALAAPTPTEAAAAKPPRIVKAAMLDVDHDDRADRVVLTYSKPINHAVDKLGFPFKVKGYRITKIAKAKNSKVLVITIKEKGAKDVAARPVVSYAPTRKQPVVGKNKKQAAKQAFKGIKALDLDADGYAATDCAPTDADVNPGRLDAPDLEFLDSDCDGIDGKIADSVFVDASTGNDANPGTMTQPVKTLQGAYAVQGNRTRFLIAGFSTNNAPSVDLPVGASLFGGYVPGTWQRSHTKSRIIGTSFTTGGGITLQLLDIEMGGDQPALKTTGEIVLGEVDLENIGSSTNSVALFVAGAGKVHATGGTFRSGDAGDRSTVAPPKPATPEKQTDGGDGIPGLCDDDFLGNGGLGGGISEGSGEAGGSGGGGGYKSSGSAGNGQTGAPGSHGATGGTPGLAGNPGAPGGPGSPGAPGVDGSVGSVVTGSFGVNGYQPAQSGAGTSGTHGKGGGGGGGGGGQVGAVVQGRGNGGAGGGEGGGGGLGGTGGLGGYASIAVYMPLGSLDLHGTKIVTGTGGSAQPGGAGATGGQGGDGGDGAAECTSEIGAGGDGGDGGQGGDGGPGASGQAGHSIGVFTGNLAFYTADGVTYALGSVGTGPQGIRVNVY